MADKFYSLTHEWAEMGEDGLITVGLTTRALAARGNIVSVTLPEPGRSAARDEACGLVEGEDSAMDIHAPLSGTITEPNAALPPEPALLNQAPESAGWLFKMRLADPASLAELMDQAGYDAYAGSRPDSA